METRCVILEAAQREFSKNGYHRTSMDNIAAAAGLSKGALYYFYKNKNQLYLAIVEEGLNLQFKELDEIIASGMETRQAIRKIVEAFVNICLDNPHIAVIILNENVESLDTELSKDIKRLLEKLSLRVQTVIEEGEKYGCIKKLDKELMAVAFLGMLAGIVVRQLNYPDKLERALVIDTLYKIIAEGIIQ